MWWKVFSGLFVGCMLTSFGVLLITNNSQIAGLLGISGVFFGICSLGSMIETIMKNKQGG